MFKIVNKLTGNTGFKGTLSECKNYWMTNKLYYNNLYVENIHTFILPMCK